MTRSALPSDRRMKTPAQPFDRRLTPARADLAAAHLRGSVEAARFVEPVRFRVTAATVPLRRECDAKLAYETELLHGEHFDAYEVRDGWAWGQAARDGYVGYLPEAALGAEISALTHRVVVLRSFLYPAASIKATPSGFLPFGAAVTVAEQDGRFVRTPAGYLFADHLALLDWRAPDPVAEAERFLGVPYLWGGKSSLGIDCSGLVQTVCHAAGISALRDSDMQEAALGRAIAIPNDPAHFQRGDLLFWPGHVALAQGAGRVIHATAYSMSVISEDIAQTIARIEGQGHPLRTVRRLEA